MLTTSTLSVCSGHHSSAFVVLASLITQRRCNINPASLTASQANKLRHSAAAIAEKMQHADLVADAESTEGVGRTPAGVLAMLVQSYVEEVAAWAVSPCNVAAYLSACFAAKSSS